MDSIVSNHFLFSFQGRINRFKYWYAAFASMTACLVFMAVLAFVIAALFGAGVKSVEIQATDIFSLPPALPFHASFRDTAPGSAATLIALLFYATATPVFIFSLWFLAATTIKRLHDRNKSGWWIVAFLVAPPLLRGIADRLDESSAAAVVLSLAAIVLTVWGFIELLFIKGTSGPNQFGPDPRAPVTAPREASPGWDQHSELEFVPHGAGPSAGPHVNRGP